MEIIGNRTPNERFWIVIKFALVISIVEMFSQTILKHRKYPFLGICGYIIVALILYNSYNYEGMGHMNLVWSCASIIFCYAASFYCFGEKINNYTFVAISFAILSIYFSHLSDEDP